MRIGETTRADVHESPPSCGDVQATSNPWVWSSATLPINRCHQINESGCFSHYPSTHAESHGYL